MLLSLWQVCITCFFFVFFSLQAIFKLIPKDELSDLPDDENTAEKRADKLWSFFDKGENGEILWFKWRLKWNNKYKNYLTIWDFISKTCAELWMFSFLLLPPDRVAEGEFIQGVLDNDEALRLIQYEPSK